MAKPTRYLWWSCLACAAASGCLELSGIHNLPEGSSAGGGKPSGGRPGAAGGTGGMHAGEAGFGGESSGGEPGSASGATGSGGQRSGGGSGGGDPSGGSGNSESGGTSSGGGDNSGGTSSGGSSSYDCNAHDLTSPSYMAACFSTFKETILTANTEPRGYYDEDYDGLVLYPAANSWLDGKAGYLLYQELSGDFLWEVEVSAQNGLDATPDTSNIPHSMVGLLAIPWQGPLVATVKDAVHYSIKTGLSEPDLLGGILYDDHLSVMAELFAPDLLSSAPVKQRVNSHFPSATDHMRLRLCRAGRQIWTGYRDRENTTGWTSYNAYGVDAGYETGDGYLPALTDPLIAGITAEFDDPEVNDPPRIVIHRSEIKAVKKLDDCKKM